MDFVGRNGSLVTIRHVPFVLLFVTAIFGLIPLAISLFLILSGVESDGKIFGLLFGLFMLWLMLEFVATREYFRIDLSARTLERTVSGVFKTKKQLIDWHDATAIILEIKRNTRGRKVQYLYLYGSETKHLINSPSKVYINHGKLGKKLSEILSLPFEEQDYGVAE
ncbi:MAG TPA: hypothetical protein VNA17_09770 [Pyrinomonadaceae bacterium]|nr:hypothetical protein [Pyrinomonadaceae bacterium]